MSFPDTVSRMGRAGRCPRVPRVPHGFTLVERLVVLAIVGVLVALLVPALSAALALSEETSCLNNLRQIGLAAHSYACQHGTYPRAYVHEKCRWMDILKLYLPKQCAVYRCPADCQQIPCTWDPEIILSYGMNAFNFAGERYCFWYGVAMNDVRRSSGVILVADCAPGKYYWGAAGSSASRCRTSSTGNRSQAKVVKSA